MDNNPNIIDSIYTPDRCVIYINDIGRKIRNNRDLFLSKQIMIKMRGYAYSQMKLLDKKEASNEKRAKLIEQFGYDTKIAYHIVRILLEIEQILTTHTLNIEKDHIFLKQIRNGEYTLNYLKKYILDLTSKLDNINDISSLREYPDAIEIKKLLIECLEMKYDLSFLSN